MKVPSGWGIAFAGIILIGIILFGQSAKGKKSVSVEEAEQMIQKDSSVVVLDVRTPEEYNGDLGHIEHSVLIPIQELEQRSGELLQHKGKTILAVCRSGRRSGKATDLLSEKGFTVLNVEGGMVQWNEKKLAVEKEESEEKK